jgi:hypothetical protein
MSITAVIPHDLEKTIETYQHLRALMIRLHSEMSRLARKDDRYTCAKRLGMLSKRSGKKALIFEHELEMDFFQDYLIHMYRPHGINLVQQMLNSNRYPKGSEERSLLERMATARFSVFRIEEVISTAGVVAHDLNTGDEYFITDMTLPQQDVRSFLIAFRIFQMDDFWMHTGACLPFGPSAEAPRFTSINRTLDRKEEQQLNENVVFKWREIFC